MGLDDQLVPRQPAATIGRRRLNDEAPLLTNQLFLGWYVLAVLPSAEECPLHYDAEIRESANSANVVGESAFE
jgi:hypothetical protein